MNLGDCMIEEFRTAERKYGMKITHVPTGYTIEGNCSWIDKIEEVKQDLLKRLEESIKDAPILPVKKSQKRADIVEECAKIADQWNAKGVAEQIRRIK